MGDLDKFLPLHANELLFWLPSAHAATLPLNPSPHTSGLPHIQQSHNKKKKYKKTTLFPFTERHHPPPYFLSSVPSSPLGKASILQKLLRVILAFIWSCKKAEKPLEV